MSERRLRLPARVVRELREALLRDDEQERFAFVDAGTAAPPAGAGAGEGEAESEAPSERPDLLASEVVPVPDERLARQSRTACRPEPAVERDHVGDCYDRQLAPVLVHSHPFSDDPRFSSIDVEAMGRFREWLTGLFPDRPFGFAVVGQSGIEAVANAGERFAALPVEVVGEWKLDEPVPGAVDRFAPVDAGGRGASVGDAPVADGSEGDRAGTDDADTDTDIDATERFDRNVRALGADGQRRLQDATVGIVGVGGIGSQVAEQFARLGVGELVLVDPDTVEPSNLPRLVGAYDHHVGKPKVDAVREHAWRSAPADLDVTAVAEPVEAVPARLTDCDLVVGCVDRVTARSFCNEWAVKHLTYYVDAGVRIDTTDDRVVGMTGYVHLVAPGSTACFDCLGRHDQAAARIERLSPDEREAELERGYIDTEQVAPEPAVIHLNGLCASKAVSVGTDVVTGVKTPPDFVRYEDTAHEMTALTTEPSPACPTCGDEGVLGVGRRSFGDAQFTPEDGPETATSD
ncbi:HesA/MoeB/ThiF family protein [Haloglomus litoreum]|uniref:HesA/MoeB/ThiF family protein n=1 Tax=Haloglomus litoreum TaxID=3034026 RepID=UPI0023E8E41C|nr:ThiF family adenylyltransferase [Haloglomus sp. DT116]